MCLAAAIAVDAIDLPVLYAALGRFAPKYACRGHPKAIQACDTVSSQVLQAWVVLQAYRLACHYGDTEEQVHETMKISSSAVFNKLMLFVLKEADSIFLRMLSLDEQTMVTSRDVQRAKRLKKVENLLKSFLGNSLHLLGKLYQSF